MECDLKDYKESAATLESAFEHIKSSPLNSHNENNKGGVLQSSKGGVLLSNKGGVLPFTREE